MLNMREVFGHFKKYLANFNSTVTEERKQTSVEIYFNSIETLFYKKDISLYTIL